MTTQRSDRAPLRIAIGACLVATTAIAITFATYKSFGVAGAAIALAGFSCVWFTLSRTNYPSLLPINSERLTVTELITLLALCALMYGFSLPSVMSAPRGQPPAVVPVPTSATTIQNGG